ncbi:MAG: beta-N-acetylhexosaminidase, partial [Armatimonadetes bacterium]|nr:beta-N-acetylhexosaminidase [Armatimonadota bacterium]
MSQYPVRNISFLLFLTLVSPVLAQTSWSDFADLAKEVAPLDPTPMGEGHLGRLESGACAQVRFPVPKMKPLGYRVCLGNVVAYSGRGTSYQLILRRDNDKGTVVYEGPVIAKGDDWNADNRNPIDLLNQLTDKDYQQGYLDICITAKVTDDGWTLYRHNPQGRGISAQIVEATEEVRRSLRETDEMGKRGVAVIPIPQAFHLSDGSLTLSANSRIVLIGKPTAADRFAAKDLADQIKESTQLQLQVVAAAAGKARDIVLRRVSVSSLKDLLVKARRTIPGDCSFDQAYSLTVTDRVVVTASGEAGLFYGAQTVAQMIGNDARIPRCTVSDWPDYPLRGLQWDVARGQTVKVDFWKFALREFARCKLNAIMIYG